MLSKLATKLGLRGLFGGPPWRARLAERGMDPLALRVLGTSRDLGDAWMRCPRVDWALELSARAPVPAALLEPGIDRVLAFADGWPGRAALEESWLRARTSEPLANDAIEALSLGLIALVDGCPEVREVLAELSDAERWRARERIRRAADRYDTVHAETHRDLAEAFRGGVPLDAIRRALGDEPSHPYR